VSGVQCRDCGKVGPVSQMGCRYEYEGTVGTAPATSCGFTFPVLGATEKTNTKTQPAQRSRSHERYE
jgi:hypothetical protein